MISILNKMIVLTLLLCHINELSCLLHLPFISKSVQLHAIQDNQIKNLETFHQDFLISDNQVVKRLYHKPEVLAPAGGWPQLKAAAENGADAVYFGLEEGFNARARASNFPLRELPDVMTYLHDRGMKGYLTINVLIFDSELKQFQDIIQKVANAGVDALIMQDIGAVTYVRRVAPNLPIHGSTQMSITDHHGALFANALGINRVVVGRELSISEMEKVVERANNVEIEAFVHGALCVSYSGQCYSSEAWGGRSANRGQCAQACRMPYGLIVNGTLKSLEQDVQYLLSPQDLMAVDYVPQLIEAGVKSFKIEGRLKGPEYVALTTRAYRNAIDEIWDKYISKKMLDASELSIKDIDYDGLSQQDRRDLVQVFSRGQDSVYDGLSAGFLLGVKHQNLVRGNAPRHRGLYIGHVLMVLKGNIEGLVVELVGPIKRGDGIVIDRRKPEEREEGGTVYEVYQNGKSIPKGVETEFGIATLMFASGAIDFSRISKGDLVWRSKDPTLEHRLKDELNQSNKGLIPVQISISGNVDQPLKVTIQDIDGKGLIGVGESITLLTPAKSRGISVDDISKAIGKLGGTTLRLDDSSGINISNLTKNMFLPVAELKLARRKAVTAFISQLRYNDRNKNLNTDSSLLDDMRKEASILANSLHLANPSLFESNSKEQTEALPPKLSVLCRTPLQVFAACRIQWLEEIVLDFLEVHGLRDMVHVVQSAGKIAVVAMPRIIKPDEDRLLFFYLRLKADAILVRSACVLDQISKLGGSGVWSSKVNATIPSLRGDFSLNAANALSASILFNSGLERLTPTHDCNVNQIIDMQNILQTNNLEVILHQHLAVFHTEHCVFCRFLSTGNSYKDCGHPCETNRVSLRSIAGEDHLVLADQGCRNTIFNAQAQTGAEYLPQLVTAGIKHYRIELVDESPDYVEPLLNKYQILLQTAIHKDSLIYHKQKLPEILTWLKSVPNGEGKPQGVSSGSLKPTVEIQWNKMKTTAYQE